MKGWRIRIAGLILAAAVLAGCSFGTMQTAKTLGEDRLGIFVGGNLFPNVGDSGGGFIPEIGFRYGVTEQVDIGARLFGLGFIADAKFGLLQSTGTGPSLALLGGAGYASAGDSGLVTAELGTIASIELGGLAPYLSVKYRYFGASLGDEKLLKDFSGEFTVIGLGIQLFSQSKFSLFVEADRLEAIKLLESAVSGNSRWLLSVGIALKV